MMSRSYSSPATLPHRIHIAFGGCDFIPFIFEHELSRVQQHGVVGNGENACHNAPMRTRSRKPDSAQNALRFVGQAIAEKLSPKKRILHFQSESRIRKP